MSSQGTTYAMMLSLWPLPATGLHLKSYFNALIALFLILRCLWSIPICLWNQNHELLVYIGAKFMFANSGNHKMLLICLKTSSASSKSVHKNSIDNSSNSWIAPYSYIFVSMVTAVRGAVQCLFIYLTLKHIGPTAIKLFWRDLLEHLQRN